MKYFKKILSLNYNEKYNLVDVDIETTRGKKLSILLKGENENDNFKIEKCLILNNDQNAIKQDWEMKTIKKHEEELNELIRLKILLKKYSKGLRNFKKEELKEEYKKKTLFFIKEFKGVPNGHNTAQYEYNIFIYDIESDNLYNVSNTFKHYLENEKPLLKPATFKDELKLKGYNLKEIY